MSRVHCVTPCNSRLRSALSLFLIFALTIATQAQQTITAPMPVTLKRGQVLHLALLSEINSSRAKVGDNVSLQLVVPLLVDGKMILPAQWTVHGAITKVKRAGKDCRDGEVDWKLDPIDTPARETVMVQRVDSYPPQPGTDPQWVPLDTPLKKVGRGFEIAGLATVVVALSPLTVPMALTATEKCRGGVGQEQSFPPGREFLAAVSRNVRVTALLERTKEPTPPQ